MTWDKFLRSPFENHKEYHDAAHFGDKYREDPEMLVEIARLARAAAARRIVLGMLCEHGEGKQCGKPASILYTVTHNWVESARILCFDCAYGKTKYGRGSKFWLDTGDRLPKTLRYASADDYTYAEAHTKTCSECGADFSTMFKYARVCPDCCERINESFGATVRVPGRDVSAHVRRSGWKIQDIQYHGGMFDAGEW